MAVKAGQTDIQTVTFALTIKVWTNNNNFIGPKNILKELKVGTSNGLIARRQSLTSNHEIERKKKQDLEKDTQGTR